MHGNNSLSLIVLTGGICQTNTYIGTSCDENGTVSRSAVIVDPVISTDCILSVLERVGCDIKSSFVLVTHGHFDHTATVADLGELGAKICISQTDYEILKDYAFDFKLDGFPGTAVKPFKADRLLNDGDTLEIGGVDYKVMATPGHTAGSVCFIAEKQKIILSGDTLFCMGVGRTDFPHGDSVALNNSLKKLFSLSGDYTVYPGHGQQTTLDFERKFNPYAL